MSEPPEHRPLPLPPYHRDFHINQATIEEQRKRQRVERWGEEKAKAIENFARSADMSFEEAELRVEALLSMSIPPRTFNCRCVWTPPPESRWVRLARWVDRHTGWVLYPGNWALKQVIYLLRWIKR